MTKKLLVVAASGLVLAILLLSAAWVVGGQAMVDAIHHGGWSFTFDDDDHGHGAKVTRSFTFNPDAPLSVDAPVHLHFERGDHVSMTVSGSAVMMNALRWDNNHLSMNDGPTFGHHELKVEIVAPQLPPLSLDGAGSVSLENLDQQELRINLSGAGNVEASGKVHAATVSSSGAGNVDLGDLDATDATVSVAGVGNIDVNASGKVDANVAGAGNVTLHRKPAQLTSQITGIGSVDHDY
jgi:carbon monoxide dehydrogenase subunit G